MDPFIVFRGESGYQVVVNHEQAVASEATILNQYRIPSAVSDGLFDVEQLAAQP
jgi:hypothetical protein